MLIIIIFNVNKTANINNNTYDKTVITINNNFNNLIY